jgi:hypothetical protein
MGNQVDFKPALMISSLLLRFHSPTSLSFCYFTFSTHYSYYLFIFALRSTNYSRMDL